MAGNAHVRRLRAGINRRMELTDGRKRGLRCELLRFETHERVGVGGGGGITLRGRTFSGIEGGTWLYIQPVMISYL
jgi:hypothetical protein